MRRRLGLTMAAAVALAVSTPGLAEVMVASMPRLPPPPPRRRAVVMQPESEAQRQAREIAEHNAAVAARRAEKRARKANPLYYPKG